MGRRTFFGLPGNMLKGEPLFNAAAGLIFLVKKLVPIRRVNLL